MSEMIKVYIVDIEEKIINRVEQVFYEHHDLGYKVIGSAHNHVSCLNDIDTAKGADVFLISAYLPDQMGYDLVERLRKIKPDAKIVVMVTKQTRNLTDISMAKGADEVIQKPFQIGSLIETFEQVLGTEKIEEAKQAAKEEEEEYGYPEEPVQESSRSGFDVGGYNNYEKPEKENNRQISSSYKDDFLLTAYGAGGMDDERVKRVVTFYSTGSNGKTTLLVNSAVAVSERSELKPKVCIVDLNFMYPSVVNKFNDRELIMCRKNIYDLFEDMTHLDDSLLDQAMITHEPTGIKILNTPGDSLRNSDYVSADQLEHLIAYLKDKFDLVLIDTSVDVKRDSVIFPLTYSDKSIILIEPDISNILNTMTFTEMFKRLEANSPEKITNKFVYVLNKNDAKTGVGIEEIKGVLQTDIRLRIPNDANVTFLSNDGQFVVNENTNATKPMLELGRLIYPFSETFDVDSVSSKKSESKFGIKDMFGSLLKRKK